MEQLQKLIAWFMEEECSLLMVHLSITHEDSNLWVIRTRVEDTVGNRSVHTQVDKSLSVAANVLLDELQEAQ